MRRRGMWSCQLHTSSLALHVQCAASHIVCTPSVHLWVVQPSLLSGLQNHAVIVDDAMIWFELMLPATR